MRTHTPISSAPIKTSNKDIATALYAIAIQYKLVDRVEVGEVFNDGQTVIKCRLYYENICRVADKFDTKKINGQAKPRRYPKRTPKQSKFSQRIYDGFIKDGEHDNARAYIQMTPRG